MKYQNLPLGLMRIGVNPKPIEFSYVSSLAPHVETERVSYTVPTARRAMIVGIDLNAVRATAAGSASFTTILIKLTKRGDGETIMIRSASILPSVSDNKSVFLPLYYPIFPGDTLKAYTLDLSTGGTVAFSLSAVINEFDVREPGEVK